MGKKTVATLDVNLARHLVHKQGRGGERHELHHQVHDLHSTMLHCLGIGPSGFTVKFQGLDAKLTGVEGANVRTDILA